MIGRVMVVYVHIRYISELTRGEGVTWGQWMCDKG